MSYVQYIREHKIWFIIFGILLTSIEIFLLTFSGSQWLMIYVLIGCLAGFFLGTYFDFARCKRYFDNAEQMMEGLDKKYLLCEMLESGSCQEEKAMKHILYEMERSMNENVSGYRRGFHEYKEYVETWVHEIKLPIATAKMIMTNSQNPTPGIEEEINRIEDYVEQALFYARSNEVEKDYFINRINLEHVIQGVIVKRRKVLRSMNAKIDMHDINMEICSDSKWLDFMLGQVIDNSVKYNQEGQLVLEIFCEKRDNSVLLNIRDNGIGIKESEISKVFDKGFTGSNGRAGKKSTGIGLYLCRKLCQRLEHNILVDSKSGQGTTVTFIFPISKMMTLE